MCALTLPGLLEGFVERTLGRATSLQVELTEDRHPQDMHESLSDIYPHSLRSRITQTGPLLSRGGVWGFFCYSLDVLGVFLACDLIVLFCPRCALTLLDQIIVLLQLTTVVFFAF